MAIDAYSLCPGGTGKKIKFCCNDFLPELQKIDRMLEGDQPLACLQHIDRLLAADPGHDRACLLATKCELLRATGQMDAARETTELFLEKYPDNQIALAESALVAAEEDPREGLLLIQKALRAANGQLSGRVYQAMGLLSGLLLHSGFPMAARGLLQLQCDVAEKDSRPQELLAALCQAADVPLLLREDQPLMAAPEDAAWVPRFNEAMEPTNIGDWQTAIERLAALAKELPNEAPIWHNLAVLRGWLGDQPGCIDALRAYSKVRSAEADGEEDAVEAEATAMFLSDDPLGDRLAMLKMVWTVKDVDRLNELLLSSAKCFVMPFDPSRFSDGENPPPKGAWLLLDRPMPSSADDLTAATIPTVLGQALLFGRQTDRVARLEVMGVSADDLPAVKELVQEVASDTIAREVMQEGVGHWSATQKLLRASWQPPRGTKPEQLRPMLEQHTREAALQRWPELKLGILGRRTPKDAATDPAYHIKLQAAILVLEFWLERLPGRPDVNELRTQLGLPVPGPIDSATKGVMDLPVIRLKRLVVDGLADKDLVMAYYRAAAFADREAVQKFASAVIERPSLAKSRERLQAFASLARAEEDLGKAIEYVDQGRQAALELKQSCASWDLLELSFRFARREGEKAMALIQHIESRHLEERGVGEALTHLLIDVGLLRPDGTPAFAPPPGAPMAPAEATAAAEPGELWTPDKGDAGSSGGGKLWTPD